MSIDWAARRGDHHRDEAFPTLAECLAPEIPGVAPLSIYYSPGRRLQVVHRLAGGGALTRQAVPLGSPPPRLEPGESWDPDLGCVVRLFPHDPGLPQLRRLVRAHGITADDVLAYRPGARAVIWVDDWIGKVGSVEKTRRNHNRLMSLWSSASRGFEMARPLSIDGDGGVRWESRMEGVTLKRALPLGSLDDVAESVSRQLAALHRTDPSGLVLVDHAPDLLEDRWRRNTLSAIGRCVPGILPRATALLDRLAALPRPAREGAVVVHGDFHAANILVGPEGAVLLDLDELGVGHPELDVAVLTRGALLAGAATGRQDALAFAHAFIRAWQRGAAPPLRAEVLAWYLAWTLVRRVKSSIRHLRPELEQTCERLLSLADATLAASSDDAEALIAELAHVAGSGVVAA